MPKSSRNRKRIPVTNAPLSKSASRPKAALKQVLATYTNTSSQSNQAIISSYHTLLKQLHQTQAALAEEEKISSPAHKELKSKLAEIHNSIQALGGLDAYQRASMRGGNLQKGWNVTGQWLIQTLRGRLGKEDQESPSLIVSTDKKLRLLDVGALYGDTYLKYSSWIETTSIDLNPQSHLVTKQDFFERPVPSSSSSTELAGQSMNKDKFDIVCLSLVVNFVTDPAKRGEMLQKTRAFLVDRGILYIVLPLPCITNSRYMTPEHFLLLVESLGFKLVNHRFSKKLAYYVFQLGPIPRVVVKTQSSTFKKKERNPGPARNNFCITLPG